MHYKTSYDGMWRLGSPSMELIWCELPSGWFKTDMRLNDQSPFRFVSNNICLGTMSVV